MRCLDSFIRDEKGAVTIEFVLWVPVIMALVAIVIDATTIYITHSEMWNVARDTARRMSSALITCEDDAVQHALDTINLREGAYDVQAFYGPTTGAQVIVTAPLSDITITPISEGLYRGLMLSGGTISARVIMRQDPRITFDCGTGGGPGGGPGGEPGGGPGGGPPG